jgi:diaminopimelate decarboxylase
VAKYGSPLYIYSIPRITERFKEMSSAFSKFPHKIHYACKALTNSSIIKHLGSLGCGVDAVSIGEVRRSLAAGIAAADIIFTPSGPSEADIDFAYKNDIAITLDSICSLEYWGERYADKAATIRINPQVFAGGDEKISVAGADSKFGISIDLADKIFEIMDKHNFKVKGLHIHTGSDIKKGGQYFAAVDRLVELSSRFPDLEFLDFGSGFKVKYHKPDCKYDKDTDMEEYSNMLMDRWRLIKRRDGRELEFKFEPGKFLVSDSGYFVTTCNAVKENPVIPSVSVDSGLNHLIRPMMYGQAYHKISNITNLKGKEREYNVVGYICETDTFGSNRTLNEVRKGDLIMLHNAGAYCYSMASNYNSHCRPAEVAVADGKDYLIMKRESYEDMMRNEVIAEF